MLIECPACKREVSDQALSCPHCGHPIKFETPAAAGGVQEKRGSTPIFLMLSVVALFLLFGTPRLLLFFPLMGTVVCAAISWLRRERGRGGAVAVACLGLAICVLGDMGTGTNRFGSGGNINLSDSTNLNAAEISDFNWWKDSEFGTRGAIKWNVKIRNKSAQNIESAKVQFETYDKAGKLISSNFTYVNAIPSGQARSKESYADLYGIEKTANAQLVEVRFAH